MKKAKTIYLAVIISLFGFTHYAHATSVPVVDGSGQILTGIDGIDLLGGTWNVQFIDGTADAIFGLAGINYDFHNVADATTAATALLDVIDSPTFAFWDENTANIEGIGANLADIITPYSYDTISDAAQVVTYRNGRDSIPILDTISLATVAHTLDLTGSATGVYAKWTNVSTVPVPTAAYLMGTALLGLLGFNRKRTQVVAA